MGRKRKGYGKGTFLETELFLSPAFLSLGQRGTAPRVSNCSAQMLILLMGKRDFAKIKQGGGNKVTVRSDDNRFDLTYRELASRGISQSRATRGIDELLAKGFIEIVNPGGLFEKDKAIYALSNDFLGWRPGMPPIRTRQRDVKRGFQGKLTGALKTKMAHVNEGHPHARQRGTPPEKTRASTRDTL